MFSTMTLMGPPTKTRKPEPAVIEYKSMRFLITERPSEGNMEKFITEVKKHNAKDVVRAGGATYKTSELQKHGIRVLDLPYDDGMAPPMDIIKKWCAILRDRKMVEPNCCVAIHCVAGLGRAPVLVAIALMELGMRYEDAVELIRMKRRGAINARQLDFLSKYRPRSRLSAKSKGCTVM